MDGSTIEHTDFEILRHGFSLRNILEKRKVETSWEGEGIIGGDTDLCSHCNLIVEPSKFIKCENSPCSSVYHAACVDPAVRKLVGGA